MHDIAAGALDPPQMPAQSLLFDTRKKRLHASRRSEKSHELVKAHLCKWQIPLPVVDRLAVRRLGENRVELREFQFLERERLPVAGSTSSMDCSSTRNRRPSGWQSDPHQHRRQAGTRPPRRSSPFHPRPSPTVPVQS